MHIKKGIELYNKNKNYYLSLTDVNNKEEILASGPLDLKKGIKLHQDMTIEGVLSVQYELEVGNRNNRVTEDGKLLTSQLSNKNFSDGTLVGFNNSLSQAIQPREHMYIQSSGNSRIKHNDIVYQADEFPPEDMGINYTFTLPSFFINNILDITFYFINPSEHSLDTVEFTYNIVSPEHGIQTDFSKIVFKKKGFVSTPSFRNKVANNDSVDLSNSLLSLQLKRNKGVGSSDSVDRSVYFIGMNIEHHINYYKGIRYNE
jgi:hypothetical protein